MLNVKNLTKIYNNQKILDDVSFKLPRGKVAAVIGPSGSGKSTLLRCLMQLDTFASGEIFLAGELTSGPEGKQYLKASTKAGMVFQSFNLFPNLTVLENIMTAPRLVKGQNKEETEAKAYTLLKKMDLENKAKVFPSSLSGGQAQRIAIARALALEPQLMLFDEPTSALDPELTGEVLNEIRRLAKETNMTMVIVTHELNFAKELADLILFLDQGRVLDYGPKEKVFYRQNNPKITQFIARYL